ASSKDAHQAAPGFSSGRRAKRRMPMASEWVVTWRHAIFSPIGVQNIPSARGQKVCDSQREAVIFAMGLDDATRRKARLQLPNDESGELPAIEQMWAKYHEKND